MDYLQLTTAGLKCLLPLSIVEEIFSLPELTVIPEAPSDILGILNLRGDLIPVMDLGCRLGIRPPQCRDTDVIILLRAAGLLMGVLVNQVQDVVAESAVELRHEPDYGHLSPLNTAFVAGLAQMGEELLIVINVETLIRAPAAVAALTSELTPAVLERHTSYDFYDCYWPTATPAQRSLLRQRQHHLSRTAATTELADDTLTVGVFELGREQFALPLNEIRQFVEVTTVVPIPHAPKLVVGHLPLQGEVIPVLDIREPLGLEQSPIPLKKAVVVLVESTTIAILIDDLRGIITYHYQQIRLSSFLATHDRGCIGSIIEGGQVIKLLSISQLLSKSFQLSNAA